MKLPVQKSKLPGNAILVDPTSVESITFGLQSLISMNDEERAALIASARAYVETLTLDPFLCAWRNVLQTSASSTSSMQASPDSTTASDKAARANSLSGKYRCPPAGS
jgi:trehalose-6-phosphate synthase